MNKNHDLELGRYTDAELVELTEGDAHGGATPTIVISAASAWVSNYVSSNTCPTTACTDAC